MQGQGGGGRQLARADLASKSETSPHLHTTEATTCFVVQNAINFTQKASSKRRQFASPRALQFWFQHFSLNNSLSQTPTLNIKMVNLFELR